MFKRNPSGGNSEYSRLEQYDDEDEGYYGEQTFQHPNSVLVSNHHGHCNVVPPLSQSLPAVTPHQSPPHSPRPSFSATRHFFQSKLPHVFGNNITSTAASFSSLPAIIVADLQNGNIPISNTVNSDMNGDTTSNPMYNDQGWAIVRRKRFKGKHGIGESRHPKNVKSPISSIDDAMIDEEVDPSDQVTCSVFVRYESGVQVVDQQYTMTMSPMYKQETKVDDSDERDFDDPIPVTEERFKEIVESVQVAIESNMQPTRISQGSSGSYFCRNTSGKIVGVFKPKNEEPYGRLNPKWTKWIHRHLFPCFFGRSCLIPNLGYLSEAGASLIDRRLGTNIVPYTDIVHMSSPSFHYDYLDRRSQHGLPPKIGSFQCFLTNYKDATVFFRNHPIPTYSDYNDARTASRTSVWAGGCLGRNDPQFDEDEENHNLLQDIHPHEEEDSDHTQTNDTNFRNTSPIKKNNHTFKWIRQLQKQFRREFEQLIILDYLIRNTDRGLDNWMIKYCPPKDTAHHSSSSTSSVEDDIPKQPSKGHIHVAAIDNGLAFPYKHPDQWRSYPYGWIAMPDVLVNKPFSEATRKQFLDMLTDPLWWRDTIRELRVLFELDDDFDEKMFQKQIAVLKGQGYNIVRTLKNPLAGPIDLVAMQRVVIHQDEVVIEYDERTIQQRSQQTKPRRLRAQRSTSFDVISTTSSPFYEEEDEEEEEAGRRPKPKKTSSKRWRDKIKNGLSIDLGRNGLFGISKKKKKNRYRAFDSDGDLSDDNSSDSDSSSQEEPRIKRVTIIMETIEVVKSKTYFTCW